MRPRRPCRAHGCAGCRHPEDRRGTGTGRACGRQANRQRSPGPPGRRRDGCVRDRPRADRPWHPARRARTASRSCNRHRRGRPDVPGPGADFRGTQRAFQSQPRILQLRAQDFLAVDIGAGTDPAFDSAGLVSDWQGPRQHPVILPRAMPQAVLDLVGFPGGKAVLPGFPGARQIVGMQDRSPVVADGCVERHAGKFIMLPVVVIVVAVRQGRPDHLRHGVRDQPEPGLAFLDCPLLQYMFRNVFDAVDDVGDFSRGAEDRAVERFPVPDFEFALGRAASGNIVFLQRHGIGTPVLQYPHQRCSQVPHARRAGVVRVVREDLEQVPSQDLFPRRHGGVQARLVGCHHGEVGRQDQVGDWRCIE